MERHFYRDLHYQTYSPESDVDEVYYYHEGVKMPVKGDSIFSADEVRSILLLLLMYRSLIPILYGSRKSSHGRITSTIWAMRFLARSFLAQSNTFSLHHPFKAVVATSSKLAVARVPGSEIWRGCSLMSISSVSMSYRLLPLLTARDPSREVAPRDY